MSKSFTIFLMLGAIQKKILTWHTGFWANRGPTVGVTRSCLSL
jgi:hypothetical protein